MRIALVPLLAVFFAAPLAAQPQARDAKLIECAAIATDADRLACYDRTVAALSAEARAVAEARAAVAATAAAKAATEAAAAAEAARLAQAETKRQAFGAEGLPADVRPSDPNAIGEIETVLTEILTNRAGQATYLLENGQLWRQIDGDATFNVRAGEGVKISRAAMGSYRMQFLRSKRFVSVRRLR